MAYKQLTTPNINTSATRGWCLKYVDDCVNAPSRKANAQLSYNTEKTNGQIRTSALPTGIWVPIFFSINSGSCKGLGHVAWAINRGTYIEIHDSETQTGSRAVYKSINEVLAWFGKQSPSYLGWSMWIDGVHVVEEYTPAPEQTTVASTNTARKSAKGTARVTVDVLNVRNNPSTSSTVVAQYTKGQTFNYDSYIVANGYVWLSYISYSGARRYVAEGPNDGNSNNNWVSGGIS